MTTGPSVLIVGGGTMGLAAAANLAQRGASVTVLERHDIGHELGSYTGFTRVFRHAYHEGSFYVPLARESDAAWQELGDDLLVRTGLLEFGPEGHGDLHDLLDAIKATGVEHELIEPAAARERWPFHIPDGWTVCFTPSGGYLRVSKCLDALRSKAAAGGATIRTNARVTGIKLGSPPAVILEDNTELSADKIIVAAGTGLPSILPDLPIELTCMRRALMWTTPAEEHREALSKLPVWGALVPEGFYYGFPYGDEGIPGLKLAVHRSDFIPELDDHVDPETVDRSLRDVDRTPAEDFLHLYFPTGQGEVSAHRVCMYCTTPTWDFLVDRHPQCESVVIAGGFSGHGFKFAPAIGRLVTELALDDATPHPDFTFAHNQS